MSAKSDGAVCSLGDLLARHVAVVTQTAAAFKMVVMGQIMESDDRLTCAASSRVILELTSV